MTNRSQWSFAVRCLAVGLLPLWQAACSSPAESAQGAGGSGATIGGTAGGSSNGNPVSHGASGNATGMAGGGGGAGSAATGSNSAGMGGALAMGGSGGAASSGGRGGAGGATGIGGMGGVVAGVAGTAGAGGTAGGGGAGGTAGACQHGQVAGNEVLIVGDSYFALSGEITKELRLLSGANYRDVSVSGTKMGAIAASYTRNRTPQPKVVIADGGGNDILQNPGCAPGCAQEQQAVTDARNFFKQMAMDGVRDVVFLFYYDMPSMKPGLDWMRPKMLAECQQSPVPCHFVDNQPLFAGMDANTYTVDGIHPTNAAADTIAKQVWDRMQKDCIAQ